MSYSLCINVHYEEGHRPEHTVATYATREEAEWVRDRIITCSWCAPGRSKVGGKGYCYKVIETQRQVTHQVGAWILTQNGETV